MSDPPSQEDILEVEALKTPKGSVPTVKGLEQAINHVYKELVPVNRALSATDAAIQNMNSNLRQIQSELNAIRTFIGDLVGVLSKYDLQPQLEEIKQALEKLSENTSSGESSDLFQVKDALAETLLKIQANTSSNKELKAND